jgi:two-component system response regulator AlgR
MKILVVDDEPPARQRLNSLVAELGLGEVVGEAANGAQALLLTAEHRPDILLLDIRMPGMDGLEAARHLAALEQPPAVIFTTAYDSHALAAFEAQAVDYLLKPIRRERLGAAVAKAARLTRAQVDRLRGSARPARTHISATMQGRLQLVPLDRVRYFQADQKYVTVRHPDGRVLIEEPLKSLEAEFGERFLRIHRNALVAVRFTEALERTPEGGYVLRMKGVEESLEVSKRLAGAVRKRLKIL